MQTITKFSLLALAFTLAIGPASAQQSVRRTVTKTAVKPAAPRPAVAQANKTVAAPATETAAKPAVQTQAPAEKTTSAPAVARQTETHQQPVTHSSSSQTRSTTPMQSNGDKHVYINAGVGLATYYGGGLPLGVSAEVDVKNNFSVGGSFDYFRYNYGYYSGGYTFIYAGARASFHLSEALNVNNANFDPYVGASLGFRHASYHDSYGYSYSDYGNGYNSGLWLGIHAGARYLFSPKVGAFAEVGYGVSALKVGITARF